MNSKSSKLLRLASVLSVLNAVANMGFKSYGWIMTDSVSILATLTDAVLDIFAATINLIAIKLALKPSSAKYRFGYDKAQDLAVFCQSIFFGMSGLFIIFSSTKKFYHSADAENYDIGMFVMIASSLLNLGLITFQTLVIKLTNSKVIQADRLHYSADLLTNIAVIISIQIAHRFKFAYADPIFGILIALYIMYGAYHLFIKAIKNLMDAQIEPKEQRKILDVIIGFNEVKRIVNFKTRYAGNKLFIQCCLVMPGEMSLYQTHELIDKIIAQMTIIFPECEMIIHQATQEISDIHVKFEEIL